MTSVSAVSDGLLEAVAEVARLDLNDESPDGAMVAEGRDERKVVEGTDCG
jgi:hypothetical protein